MASDKGTVRSVGDPGIEEYPRGGDDSVRDRLLARLRADSELVSLLRESAQSLLIPDPQKGDLWEAVRHFMVTSRAEDEGVVLPPRMEEMLRIENSWDKGMPIRRSDLAAVEYLNCSELATDTWLSYLKYFPRLLDLDVSWSKVSGKALKYLAYVPNLRSLELSGLAISDEQLINLKYCQFLEHLGLHNCNVSDSGMKYVGNLSKLQNLNLSYTSITDNGVFALPDLKALEGLFLENTKITDNALRFISGFASLRILDLDRTVISDECLKEMIKLKNLVLVWIKETRITEGGVTFIQNALPQCEVKFS
ncbi:MAG: hypothetical protein KF836_08385 [Fimbriimonadaceae bacterium]|nr:hypothetical protein [Fimbriimonadaceae bacterium]